VDSEHTDFNTTEVGKTTSVEHLEPEPIQPRPWYVRWGRRVIGVVFIFAMLFLGGIYQFGLFQQTPASTPAGQYQPAVDKQTISIPATVYVLDQASQDRPPATTTKRLIERTNTVLTQARVQLEPATTTVISTEDLQSSTGRLAASPDTLKDQLPALRSDRLHIIVSRGLGGLNGVAFPGERVVAVSEYTTSFDFRVLAHEVGHILALDHVNDKANLMFSGSSGTDLTADQAETMNQRAHTFLQSR